jgi:hypothetical protein
MARRDSLLIWNLAEASSDGIPLPAYGDPLGWRGMLTGIAHLQFGVNDGICRTEFARYSDWWQRLSFR